VKTKGGYPSLFALTKEGRFSEGWEVLVASSNPLEISSLEVFGVPQIPSFIPMPTRVVRRDKLRQLHFITFSRKRL
jgi:hypothetical protein